MRFRTRVRGPYTTVLTRLPLENGFEIVARSGESCQNAPRHVSCRGSEALITRNIRANALLNLFGT
jgi:hypothetical protein